MRSSTRGHQNDPAGGRAIAVYLSAGVFGFPLGYYKEEGLDVAITEFAGGSQSILSVMGGGADVAAGFYEHAIEATALGKRLQAFVTMLKYPGMALVVSPKASRRRDG